MNDDYFMEQIQLFYGDYGYGGQSSYSVNINQDSFDATIIIISIIAVVLGVNFGYKAFKYRRIIKIKNKKNDNRNNK